MSVVNRMLQDIDRRVGGTALDAGSPVPDIRSIRPRAPHGGHTRWLAGVALILVAVAVLVATGTGERLWSAGDSGAVANRAVVGPPPAAVTRPTQASASSPVAPEPASGSPAAQGQPVADAMPPVHAPREPVESFKLSFDLSPVQERPRADEGANKLKPNRTSGAVRPAAVAATPSPPPASSRPVETAMAAPATPPAVRHVAAAETVASARLMWQEGSRNNAYATLREALASAEASRDPQAVRVLALDLARLELAGNRAQAALDLLRRQGALLGDDADALALRGNAQQRLVLHAEAAESYLAALRLRPTEGKWMLGAAISLAADGRAEEAQVWANRARDRGAITPPIAAYLQQLGVATRP